MGLLYLLCSWHRRRRHPSGDLLTGTKHQEEGARNPFIRSLCKFCAGRMLCPKSDRCLRSIQSLRCEGLASTEVLSNGASLERTRSSHLVRATRSALARRVEDSGRRGQRQQEKKKRVCPSSGRSGEVIGDSAPPSSLFSPRRWSFSLDPSRVRRSWGTSLTASGYRPLALRSQVWTLVSTLNDDIEAS